MVKTNTVFLGVAAFVYIALNAVGIIGLVNLKSIIDDPSLVEKKNQNGNRFVCTKQSKNVVDFAIAGCVLILIAQIITSILFILNIISGTHTIASMAGLILSSVCIAVLSIFIDMMTSAQAEWVQWNDYGSCSKQKTCSGNCEPIPESERVVECYRPFQDSFCFNQHALVKSSRDMYGGFIVLSVSLIMTFLLLVYSIIRKDTRKINEQVKDSMLKNMPLPELQKMYNTGSESVKRILETINPSLKNAPQVNQP